MGRDYVDASAPVTWTDGDAELTVEGGTKLTGTYLRKITVTLEHGAVELTYRQTGLPTMWSTVELPADDDPAVFEDDFIDDTYDLPLLQGMADSTPDHPYQLRDRLGDELPHAYSVSSGRAPEYEDGQVTYKLDYTRDADTIDDLFDVIEAETGLKAESLEDAFDDARQTINVSDPRDSGFFTS